MPSDYTIIINVRQRFGDEEDSTELDQETEAPFVGPEKTFTFLTPNVDGDEGAVLQFLSRGVTTNTNIIRINGIDLFGGLIRSVQSRSVRTLNEEGELVNFQTFSDSIWVSNHLIVNPGTLRESNELLIRSRLIPGDASNLDNFIIDNAVIHYKLRQRLSQGEFQA